MSLIFMDGFDDGLCVGGYKLYSISPSSASTTYGRLGTKGVRLGDTPGMWLQRSISMSGDTIVIGFASYINNHGAATNEYLMLGYDIGAAAWQWHVRVDEDGTIKWGLSTGSSTQSSSAGAHPDKTWCYFEIKVKHSNTVGTVDIKINGVNVLSASNIDTQNTANAHIDRLNIGGGGSGYLHDNYVDDLYILDGSGSAPYNDFLGDVRIEALLPSGNGNSSGMTGSDGNQVDNYLLVDDDPVVTTDYVESATQGHKDTYAMGNLASTNVSVYGVQVSLVVQKDNTGSKYLRPVVRSGSTDYNGTSVALNTSWEGIHEIWEQDPNTSANWTPTNVNAVEVGQEVRDS